MGQGILLSADQEVDFMVHGVFSYKWFGHTVWITTTHVCVLIVFLILGIFALCANRAMKHAIIHFNKFKYQKVSGVIKGLCEPWPFWAPINIIGDVAVPISLSLRLFANVLSGTVMMALVYGLLKWFAVFWPAALHVYFDLFSGAIQTYVFCMLTMTYVADAIGDN